MPSVEPRHAIGIVGAGGIVEVAHLPAYQQAGLPVRGIFDLNFERAAALARQFQVERVYRTLEEMLGDGSVDVIDIAVPPQAQPAIAARGIRAGKHLLCQKPLASSIDKAERLVNDAAAHSVVMAVNVNMRWEPAMRRTCELARAGALGRLHGAAFEIQYYENWSSWPWLVDSSRLVILFDTIHIIDLTRQLFGEPSDVRATYGRDKGDALAGETWVDLVLDYADGARVTITEDSRRAGGATRARFRVQGSQASVEGSLGIYYDYAVGRADTFHLISQKESSAEEVLDGRWIPDAFPYPMRELLDAIEQGTTPSNSGLDHLATLRLVDRIYRAGSGGR